MHPWPFSTSVTPVFSNTGGSKTLSPMNKVNWHCHKFQGFEYKLQHNSAVSSRGNNRVSVSLPWCRPCLLSPTPAKHFNMKFSLSLIVTLWPSQFQIKMLFGCASCDVTFLTGSPWNCESPSFLSKIKNKNKRKKREEAQTSPVWQKYILSQPIYS